MSIFTEAGKTSKDFVSMQNQLINDNLEYRMEWENEAKLVHYSYHGNKYPIREEYADNRINDSRVKRKKGAEVYVNLIKRQYRVMANFLNNNEPEYVISGFTPESQEEDEESTREFLNYIFEGQNPKLKGEDDETFYDTVMDDAIYFGLFRGIVWTLAYWTKEEGYKFKCYDSLDTYIDTSARKLSKSRKWLTTYTQSKNELAVCYPNDAFGTPIDWEKVSAEKNQTMSEVKKCFLPEPPHPDTLLIREGYYLDYNEDKTRSVYKVITTSTECLYMEKVPGLDFLPLTWFAPLGEPEALYPRGWYTDMLPLEREINLLIAKINNIIKTGGRFMYVREGTVIHKASSATLNSLGIEVFEVSNGQELPEQAQLLTVNGEMLNWLNFLMTQAEDEGGMQQDIMGSSSTGPDASGRAIQALQAGSKNNIGTALNELNKYMSRLVRVVLRLYDVYGESNEKFYSSGKQSELTMNKETARRVKVKVSVTGRDAFDEITEEAKAIEGLGMIQKFNPELRLPPNIITEILSPTNSKMQMIQDELDKQQDPNVQIADGENKMFLNGDPMNANVADDHQTHKAIHTQMLQGIPPESPVAKLLIGHIRMHDAFIEANPNQPQ